MIDKKPFQELRKTLETFDKKREELIALSRSVLKKSKAAIYSAQRQDMKEANALLIEACTQTGKLHELAKKDHQLLQTGAYHEALEEYAEAACFVHYLLHETIPTAKQLNVPAEIYLQALSDLVGELVRKAINSAAKSDYKTTIQIKKFVEELYGELMLFDFRNSPARRKFDAIKYGLEKLEDIALKIALK